jgi:precorrin-8X/cobalt-precorrin-8 methylmutase
MVAAGIPRVGATSEVLCYLDRVTARPEGRATRSEAAVDLAAGDHHQGAVWVIGNAPTALARLAALHQAGRVEPAVVIGLPVGYVGAAEAKEALWASPLGTIAVTNVGRRGGSAVAAAAVNALHRMAHAPPR